MRSGAFPGRGREGLVAGTGKCHKLG